MVIVSAMVQRYQVFAENVEKMNDGYVRKKRALPGALFFVFLRVTLWLKQKSCNFFLTLVYCIRQDEAKKNNISIFKRFCFSCFHYCGDFIALGVPGGSRLAYTLLLNNKQSIAGI